MEILFYQYCDEKNKIYGQITDYRKEILEKMAKWGFKFFAVYRDGSQREVTADEIVEPEPIKPVVIETETARMAEEINAMRVILGQLSDAVIDVNPAKRATLQAAATRLNKLSAKEDEKI